MPTICQSCTHRPFHGTTCTYIPDHVGTSHHSAAATSPERGLTPRTADKPTRMYIKYQRNAATYHTHTRHKGTHEYKPTLYLHTHADASRSPDPDKPLLSPSPNLSALPPPPTPVSALLPSPNKPSYPTCSELKEGGPSHMVLRVPSLYERNTNSPSVDGTRYRSAG